MVFLCIFKCGCFQPTTTTICDKYLNLRTQVGIISLLMVLISFAYLIFCFFTASSILFMIVPVIFSCCHIFAGLVLLISVITKNPRYKHIHGFGLKMLEYLWWITSIALVSGPFVIAFHPDNRLANSEINITLLILLIIASLVLIVLYTYSIWLVYCFSSHYDMIMNPIDFVIEQGV